MSRLTLPDPLMALVDPDSSADRFVIERFGSTMADVNPALLGRDPPPGLEARVLLLERWLHLQRTLTADQHLGDLSPDRLAAALVEFALWRSLPMPADHPLSARVETRWSEAGWRKGARGGGKATLYADNRAFRWWCEFRGFPRWVCDAAEQVAAEDRPVRRSIILSDPDIASVVSVLLAEEVPFDRCPRGRARAWHARQLACFLIQLWASLRIGEIARLHDARLCLFDDRVVIHIQKTKTGAPRWVDLWPRDDAACPVSALAAWLAAASDCNYDRHGLLLPVLRLKARGGGSPIIRPNSDQELTNLRRVFAAAGLGDRLADAGDDPTCVRQTYSTHGLRALLPNRALDAGRPIADVKALGQWSSEDTTYRYYLTKEPSSSAAQTMADDVARAESQLGAA